MKKRNILGVSLALLLASAASSQAAAIIVQNQSFESPGGVGGFPPADNWPGSSFTEISSDVGLSGGHLIRHNGQNSGTTGSQDLGVGFLADTVYTMTIAIGNRTSDSNNPTGTARFGLTAGGVEVGTFTEATSPGGTFQDFTYTFTTGAVAPTGNVGITLGATGGRGLFDNVRLDASAIPEPSTALCAVIGGLALLRRRRR